MGETEYLVDDEYRSFEYVLTTVGRCTDEYLFLIDFERNYCSFSEELLKRFNLESHRLNNVINRVKAITHPDDLGALTKDFLRLRLGMKNCQDLEYRWIDKDGDTVWINFRGQVIQNEKGKPRLMVGRISELGIKNKADNLTGLLTEPQLKKDFNKLLKERPLLSGYMMKIGINHFKEINEKHGMEVGDMVLREVSHYLLKVVSRQARVYRLGSKTFIVLCTEGEDIRQAEELYKHLNRLIDSAIEQSNYKIFYSISAGILALPEGGQDYSEVQKNAEFAINVAIRENKEGYFVFDEQIYKAYIRRIDIQEQLRQSVANDFKGFNVFYQPIIDASTHKIIGAEALLRYSCENFGPLSPVEFIPILEESGLIIPVGRWVIGNAIRQCKLWQKYIPSFHVSINLSYVQLKRFDLIDELMEYVEASGINTDSIVLEITESGHLENDNTILRAFEIMRQKKIKLAIDDFGTGYSNLRYLQEFNVDILKLDRSFVSKALRNEYDFKLVGYIIDMAHSIGLSVCLEGIETMDERERLYTLGPDYMQGYLFGKPVDVSTFERLNINEAFSS